MTLEEKRKLRRKQTAEDFTPRQLVDEMLDKLPEEVWTDPSKTFCDPAGGDGNFLIAILERKLAHGHDPLQALSTIYSVELMPDNVQHCHQRLFELVDDMIISKKDRATALKIIETNNVCHNSLEWDFENWKSQRKEPSPTALF